MNVVTVLIFINVETIIFREITFICVYFRGAIAKLSKQPFIQTF